MIMWMIRAILLALLGAYVGLAALLIRRRERYSRIVENRVSNIALVAIDLVITCALVTLPPAAGWHARPDWLRPGAVRVGFGAAGTVLVCAGLGLALCALLQRKALGLQSAPAGLITSHAYRYFRHPIYTGILWMSPGLALLTRNPDGLMVLPALFAAYAVLMLLEEHDLGITFGEQYAAYRQTTKMFGPVWLWAVILAVILLIVVSTRL
jgi:protein-S-isoprenylcysteine O-methyltransferase Ste14